MMIRKTRKILPKQSLLRGVFPEALEFYVLRSEFWIVFRSSTD